MAVLVRIMELFFRKNEWRRENNEGFIYLGRKLSGTWFDFFEKPDNEKNNSLFELIR